MWKKQPQPSPSPASSPSRTTTQEAPRARAQEAPVKATKSRIGPGITLQGEVRGEEDLVVEGRVEGKIVLESHSVAIEESGRVEADISARTIRIAGEVRGNIFASEQAVLVETARLEGNIVAKAVTIETGARFKGSIDMETVSKRATAPTTTTTTTSPAAPTREPAVAETSAPSKPNGPANRIGVG